MKVRNQRGLALVLVMTVVLALAIIATPFVLSMILQERTGTTARYLSQADYGADGAKNYALWRLMHSIDYMERRSGTGLSSSYYFDTSRSSTSASTTTSSPASRSAIPRAPSGASTSRTSRASSTPGPATSPPSRTSPAWSTAASST